MTQKRRPLGKHIVIIIIIIIVIIIKYLKRAQLLLRWPRNVSYTTSN